MGSREKEKKEQPVYPLPRATPSLNVPTPVFHINSKAASGKLSLPKRSLSNCPIARHPLYLSPLVSEAFPAHQQTSSISLPLPRNPPTISHRTWVSFFRPLHSLKRCSLVCLPFLHHQQELEPVRSHFTSREGRECMSAWQLIEAARYSLWCILERCSWDRVG